MMYCYSSFMLLYFLTYPITIGKQMFVVMIKIYTKIYTCVGKCYIYGKQNFIFYKVDNLTQMQRTTNQVINRRFAIVKFNICHG